MRLPLLMAGLMLTVGPALAVDPAAKEVSCAGAVTRGQEVRDLDLSYLPVLPYQAEPKEREFKQLAVFGDVPVRLYAYRVNEATIRLRIYEASAAGNELLADADLAREMTQLSYRSLGGDIMVTVWCY
jgi:hypothetical protein